MSETYEDMPEEYEEYILNSGKLSAIWQAVIDKEGEFAEQSDEITEQVALYNKQLGGLNKVVEDKWLVYEEASNVTAGDYALCFVPVYGLIHAINKSNDADDALAEYKEAVKERDKFYTDAQNDIDTLSSNLQNSITEYYDTEGYFSDETVIYETSVENAMIKAEVHLALDGGIPEILKEPVLKQLQGEGVVGQEGQAGQLSCLGIYQNNFFEKCSINLDGQVVLKDISIEGDLLDVVDKIDGLSIDSIWG